MKKGLACAMLLAALLFSPGVTAQSVGSEEILDRFIVVLEDDALRTQLIEELRNPGPGVPIDATVDPIDAQDDIGANAGSEPALIDAMSNWTSEWFNRLPTATFGMPVEQKLQHAYSQISTAILMGLDDGRLADFGLRVAPVLLLVLLLAAGLLIVGHRMTSPVIPIRKRRLAGGLALKVISHATLFAAVAIAAPVVVPATSTPGLFLTLAVGIIIPMLTVDLSLSSMSGLTRMRGSRLIRFAQHRFYGWALAVTFLATFAALIRIGEFRNAIGWSTSDVASFFFDILAAGTTLAFVLRHRISLGRLIFGNARLSTASGNPVKRARRQLARVWHLLAYAIIILSSLSLVSGRRNTDVGTQAAISFGIVLFALIARAMVRGWLSGRFNVRRFGRSGVRRSILAALSRFCGVGVDCAIAVAAVVLIARIWGFHLLPWITGEGQQLVRPLLAAGICAAAAWLIWISLDAWIASALTPTDAFGRTRLRSNRAQTLLPLVRNGLLGLLLVLTGIAVLANIGVDVTPLIAGAGVFGLALSFGSQQLVQDLITGLFILAEDTIAIGDTINTGDRSGIVEGISLRTVRLRDADGSLHSVPFSTIKALKNSSRNFGVFRPRYAVPSHVDPEHVLEAMRETANELRSNPDYSAAIVGNLQNLGIEEINAGSLIVSGSLRTAPLRQPEMARAFNGLLREKLSGRGITL